MTIDTHNALLEYLWDITDSDKIEFYSDDIKIHSIQKHIIDFYRIIRYSVRKDGVFKKNSFIIANKMLKKIELCYTRDIKLEKILN